ncbi:glutathione synthetase [Cyphellophora europaea CBS 101466]|uniref:Glutathione synthetase n=1 Tax=Cyphellophora europaea (strain CBS 101466) TaxID=1220924 RepID=W2RXY4_CYPE1|nr:glutathione synthetase [Cyphellophora europaea CBS 101466]ETN40648.1 glutathione synthetase [Cyphellophora europaea CBS 101466]
MAQQIFQNYPPPLSEQQQVYLSTYVKNWTIQHGLTVRPSAAQVSEEVNPNAVLATNAPVSLFPSPFPRKLFKQAQSLQTVYNELYAAIASNETFLESVMKELIDVDDFLSNLWKIHLDVKAEGYTHEHALGLFRSDFMLDAATDTVKQVEFNTISSSFGGLSSLVTQLHTELASFPAPATSLAYPPHPLFKTSGRPNHPPPNEAVPTLARGLASAHKAYGPAKSSPALPLCVLFLVQPSERNIFDQLALSSRMHTSHNVATFRLPTTSVLEQTTIGTSSPSRPLIYHPPSAPGTAYEVTTVYFRALYAPSEYTSPTFWQARHHLERSAAIKCPSILLHLSGSKKIQQVLTSTEPDHLGSFLPNASAATLDSLRSTFAPQYALDSEGLALATNPDTAAHHVLKPQREGGGNNIYRDNIPPFLASMPEKDYKQYILMELIHPPASAHNTVLRSDGEVVSGDVISELGTFGTCLWKTPRPHDADAPKQGEAPSTPEILHNEEGGYLLRTKASGSDEGGVATGFSSLDSVLLYDDEHLH